MGLFVNVNEASMNELDYDSFIECHEENMLEAGTNILIEAEQNWNAIMKAVGIEEVKAYAEGTEAITEAGRIGGMLEKAKQFFMNLWKKVVGMFKKLLSIFEQQASKDKAFVKKYRTEIAKKMGQTDWNKDLTVDVYPFSGLGTHTKNAMATMTKKCLADAGIGIAIADVAKNITTTEAGKLNSLPWKDELSDRVRSWSFGESSEESEAEFRKLWKEKIYGDKDNKDVDQKMVLDALNTIDGSENDKKTLKNTFKPMDDSLKLAIKNLEKAINNTKFKDKDDKDMKDEELKEATDIYAATGIALNISKAAHTTMTSIYSMECQAIKDRNRQARAIVGKVYRRPVKEAGFEHFEESAEFGNAFDNVVLV